MIPVRSPRRVLDPQTAQFSSCLLLRNGYLLIVRSIPQALVSVTTFLQCQRPAPPKSVGSVLLNLLCYKITHSFVSPSSDHKLTLKLPPATDIVSKYLHISFRDPNSVKQKRILCYTEGLYS
jgi:hypothetical protein